MVNKKVLVVTLILSFVCSLPLLSNSIAERMYTRDLSELEYLSFFFSWWYNTYFDYPVVVRICLLLILCSSISVTIFIIAIAFSKINDYFYRKLFVTVYRRFYDPFCNILRSEENLTFQQVQEILNLNMADFRKRKNKRYMFVVCSVLVHVKNDYYTPIEFNFNNMRMAVVVLGVQDFLERILMFGSVNQCRRALQIAQFLMLILPESILVRLLNSNNKVLSKETRMYYLWLSDSNPFRFFEDDNYKYTWRAWEIHFFMMSRHKAGKEIPSLTPVISNCTDIKLQASLIREVGYWGNEEDISNMKQFLDSNKFELCWAAVECFTVARVTSVEPILMDIYQSQSEKIKLYILRAVVLFKTGNAINFLVKAWNDSKVLAVKLNVLIALKMYGEHGEYEIKRLESETKNESVLHLFEVIKNFEQLIRVYQ